jgi:hypothetical protein
VTCTGPGRHDRARLHGAPRSEIAIGTIGTRVSSARWKAPFLKGPASRAAARPLREQDDRGPFRIRAAAAFRLLIACERSPRSIGITPRPTWLAQDRDEEQRPLRDEAHVFRRHDRRWTQMSTIERWFARNRRGSSPRTCSSPSYVGSDPAALRHTRDPHAPEWFVNVRPRVRRARQHGPDGSEHGGRDENRREGEEASQHERGSINTPLKGTGSRSAAVLLRCWSRGFPRPPPVTPVTRLNFTSPTAGATESGDE